VWHSLTNLVGVPSSGARLVGHMPNLMEVVVSWIWRRLYKIPNIVLIDQRNNEDS
jgi:hypothetical protein